MKRKISKVIRAVKRGPKPKFQEEILKKFDGKPFTTHDVMRKTHRSYASSRTAIVKLIEKGMVVFTGKVIPTGGRPEQVLKIDQRKMKHLLAS